MTSVHAFALVVLFQQSAHFDSEAESRRTTEATERCVVALREAAVRSRAIANMLDADMEYAKAHNNELPPQRFEQFIRWYQAAQLENPVEYPSLSSRPSMSDEIKMRIAFDRFREFRTRQIDEELVRIKRDTQRLCPAQDLSRLP